MKSKAIGLALLAFALGAQADVVSSSQAASAARAWAGRTAHLGVRLNTKVEKTSRLQMSAGATLYAIKMSGGGTVFMAGDTECHPIVMFTSATNDFSEIDRQSPLWALLNRGLAAQPINRTPGLAYAGPEAAANVRRWQKLLGSSGQSDPKLSYGEEVDPLEDEPSDLRVSALMRSEWSQGGGVFNYYTPEKSVCGCVATAMAQVMRYLHGPADEEGDGGLSLPFPIDDVPQQSFTCTYNGKDRVLKLQGGQYDWENMPFANDGKLTEKEKKAIGKLTSDAGISVKMAYTKKESGAFFYDVPVSLIDTFGYKQVVWVDEPEADGTATDALTASLFANFDVGRPCLMGIPGHAIVADGYGFEGEVPFVHLNMGWGGQCDMWYNLPNMKAAGEKYTAVDGIGYNIFPEAGGFDEEGKMTHAILSGRVLDYGGDAVSGIVVQVFSKVNGVKTAVTNLTTDAHGIWAAFLPAGVTYLATAATADKEWFGEKESALEAPAAERMEGKGPPLVGSADGIGNSWGNDIWLEHPSVRVGEEIFSTLDRALDAARTAAETAAGPVSIELLDETFLMKSCTIDFACAFSSTNANPYLTAVLRNREACLNVATNGCVAFSNVVFAGSEKRMVDVASNGVIAVSGLVDFGVPDEVPSVRTADAFSFRLAGLLERGFTLDCTVSAEQGLFFGRASGMSPAVAASSAAKIANAADPLGEMRGSLSGTGPDYYLWWEIQQVPLGEAVGYYLGVDADGNVTTNTAARLDRLLSRYDESLTSGTLGTKREIVVLRDAELTVPLTVADGLTLRGENGAEVRAAGSAAFTVTGGRLEVSGLKFSDYVGNALFVAQGPSAALEIGGGVTFSSIEGTNGWSGAVVVLGGASAKIGETCFENCRATGNGRRNSFGGAVYVEAGGRLELCNGTVITNCQAANYGGAVYAQTNTDVLVSGKLQICGNRSGMQGMSDDIRLCASTAKLPARFALAGSVSGTVGVCWDVNCQSGNGDGETFVTTPDARYAHESAKAFFNDVDASLMAAVATVPDGLMWTAAPIGPQPVDDGSAEVVYADGRPAVTYYNLSEALQALDGDATIKVTDWDGNFFDQDLVIRHKVTIESDTGNGIYTIERHDNCSIKVIAGGELTLKDIVFYGCETTNVVDGIGCLPTETRYTVPLFDVKGGKLTLATPSTGSFTEIAYVYGERLRNANAVTVWDGGTFEMQSGARIEDCCNFYVNEADGAGRGGALLVDGNGKALLKGGTITGCAAYTGGGVFVGNGTAVNVSGDMTIDGNFALRTDENGEAVLADANNLVVNDRGTLILDGEFTGTIGYTEGASGSPEVFGRVSEDFTDVAKMTASAHNFRHDANNDIGMVVGCCGTNLLVWSEAIADDKTFTLDGIVYRLPETAKPMIIPVPTAQMVHAYDGTAQTGVADGLGYVLTGSVSTNAGSYTAVAKLRPGYAWGEGDVADRTIKWAIPKATFDPDEIAFEDGEFTYDGEMHALEIAGELPVGVTVAYSDNNCLTEPGVVTVTATLTVDFVNYEEIPAGDLVKTATLTVKSAEVPDPPPGPTPDPKIVELPKPFGIVSLVKETDGSWSLTVNPVKTYCKYTLQTSEDLTTWTPVGEPKVSDVDADLRFSVSPEAAKAFWRILGEDGVVPAN